MAKQKKPVKILTLDTETYNGLLGGLKRLAVYDGIRVRYGYTFYDAEEILLQYSSAGFKVVCYCHNLEFDGRKLPELFEKNRIVWEKCFIINGRLARITTKNYCIQDSFKLMPKSLKSLSEDFEVEHGKLDLWEKVQEVYPNQYNDIVDFLDRCNLEDKLFLEYLGYDVISLYEVIYKMIGLTGLTEEVFVERITTASLSRYIFKNGYKGHEFKYNSENAQSDYQKLCTYNYNKDLDTEEFLRASYCGGRVEVFKPKLLVKGFHYDVNSLYPYVMLGNYPIGKPEFYSNKKVAEEYFNRWLSDKIGIGFLSCTVFIPLQNIPPLPAKMGKLCFPCGVVYGTWNFEELEFAIKECGVEILEYHEVCYYPNTFPIFYDFVQTFSKIKEQASIDKNESLRSLAKLILNVGYGYTGMRRDDKTSLIPWNKRDKYNNIMFADEELGFCEIPALIKADYIQVAVASTVTCRARLVLLKGLRLADSVGNAYYCDTDSIVCDKPLPDSMVHDTHLGKFKLEGEPIKGLFLRPKVYSELFDKTIKVSVDGNEIEVPKTTIKFKGVSKDTQKKLNFESYENLYRELEEQKKEYVIVEKNKLQMRSIMYLKKNDISLSEGRINNKKEGIESGFEIRDKKMNLRTIEKRNMDYINNTTSPHFFKTEDEYTNFSFNKINESVPFDMTMGGH